MSILEIGNTDNTKHPKPAEIPAASLSSSPKSIKKGPAPPPLKVEAGASDLTEDYPQSTEILRNGSVQVFRTLASLVGNAGKNKVVALGERHTEGSKSRKFLLDNLKNFQKLLGEDFVIAFEIAEPEEGLQGFRESISDIKEICKELKIPIKIAEVFYGENFPTEGEMEGLTMVPQYTGGDSLQFIKDLYQKATKESKIDILPVDFSSIDSSRRGPYEDMLDKLIGGFVNKLFDQNTMIFNEDLKKSFVILSLKFASRLRDLQIKREETMASKMQGVLDKGRNVLFYGGKYHVGYESTSNYPSALRILKDKGLKTVSVSMEDPKDYLAYDREKRLNRAKNFDEMMVEFKKLLGGEIPPDLQKGFDYLSVYRVQEIKDLSSSIVPGKVKSPMIFKTDSCKEISQLKLDDMSEELSFKDAFDAVLIAA